MAKVFTPDEESYVEKALQAGTMKLGEIQFVLILNRIINWEPEEKPTIWQVQSIWMDCKVGLNQHLARKAGIVVPDSGDTLSVDKNGNGDKDE